LSRLAIEALVDRTPEIVAYESSVFGEYPFDAMGGTVTNGQGGLENQTRPTYGGLTLTAVGIAVVVHEMAHMWFGDSVSPHDWRDVWLNEGFATYAEWLWSEHTGAGTAAQRAREVYDRFPADDPLWQIVVTDPGAGNVFPAAVYHRGALTLQALRATVGDAVFFDILKSWATTKKYESATTREFTALAERKSGSDLDALFHAWLYATGKPEVLP
jgi:aminopeptidase N